MQAIAAEVLPLEMAYSRVREYQSHGPVRKTLRPSVVIAVEMPSDTLNRQAKG